MHDTSNFVIGVSSCMRKVDAGLAATRRLRVSGPCNGPCLRGQARGGEDVLLNEFDGLGLHCDARTQLVVICEVCRRPSTKECWTCGMRICDFCTLKRHWKVRTRLSQAMQHPPSAMPGNPWL